MRWKWLTPGDKRAVLIMTVALVLAMLSGVGLIAGFLFLAYVVMWAYFALRRGRQ
jgi:hypothetical protein